MRGALRQLLGAAFLQEALDLGHRREKILVLARPARRIDAGSIERIDHKFPNRRRKPEVASRSPPQWP
jgi:hypothetical protein